MKHRAFRGIESEALYERSGQWLRATVFGNRDAREWCNKNGVAIRKASGEGIGTAGAYLVPAELSRAIIDIREMYGAFRRTALVMPLASDSSEIPRRTGGAVASFVNENSADAGTTATMDHVALTAKKIGALFTVSSELEEDSVVGIVDYLANETAWAFASKEDDCAFNGDGSSTYGRMRGVLTIALDGAHNSAKVTAASGHNTFLTLDSADLGSLIDAVRASAMPNAAWFVSQIGFGQTICRLSATGGGPLWHGEFNGIPTPYYLGFPVVMCAKMPALTSSLSGKGMLAFGDMYHGAVLGERRGITLARSPERYLDSDQIGILGTERFDVNVHDMGDNSNAGSLAVLIGN